MTTAGLNGIPDDVRRSAAFQLGFVRQAIVRVLERPDEVEANEAMLRRALALLDENEGEQGWPL